MWYLLSALLVAVARVLSQSVTNGPPLTLPDCGGITPAPNYHAHCNATKSFTLPNGRFVDEFNRFCACAEVVLDTERIVCEGGRDFPVISCNSDGTFNCIVTGGIVGRPRCLTGSTVPQPSSELDCRGYCEPACLRYSKHTQKFQNVYSCPCTKAQNQQFNATLLPNDNYVPQCNADGSWTKLQTGYGGSWCVDSSGSQRSDISFDAAYPPVC